MARKKKDYPILEGVEITDIVDKGKTIAKHDGKVYFVKGGVPGDLVDLEVYKKRRKYFEANIHRIIEPSKSRIEPFCKHFGTCGGCKLQHTKYDTQLFFKQKIIIDALRKIGKVDDFELKEIVGNHALEFYRNKMEFTFSNKRWLTYEEIDNSDEIDKVKALGFHVPGMFDKVVDLEECYLQSKASEKIRASVRAFTEGEDFPYFDIRKQEGLLRTLIVRTTSLDEIMVIVAFYEYNETAINLLMNHLSDNFPEITSLQYVVNSKGNDTLYDQDIKVFKGKDHIVEQLGEINYKIGPKSFFQTNSIQAKVLYDIVKDFAALKPTDKVFDFYTGTGSIALYVANDCAEVVGIEEVAPAIVDAKYNAVQNNISNSTFYAGDVKLVFDDNFVAKHGRPDVLITDPPRAGMHAEVVANILKLAPERIVYVSCNPSTQARDIELLSDKYNLIKVQGVDLFPHTAHVESVALLTLK